ncbi:MAG: LD-carboxypeptidase [Burkholderiales bacterium]|nr:LD-carboxypeptidase [Burkholderiales bacterium]
MARKPGIGFVAPSGQVLDALALERAETYFRDRGWRVVAPAAVRKTHQRFAGSDATRLAALNAMAARSDVQLVLAVRGGYGLTRLLPSIDYALLASSGQRWVGHSDFTALLCAAYAQGRTTGFAGPTAAYDFGATEVSPFTESHFWRMVEGGGDSIEVRSESPARAAIRGTLWGGNLAMIAHLVGTRFLPRVRGGILFVEDVGEHPYRIERMLHQLNNAGILGHQKALLLGDFSGYRLGENDRGYDFDAMLAHLRGVLPIPVVAGLPFGHVRDKLTLPFGGRARLEIERRAWRLSYEAAAIHTR